MLTFNEGKVCEAIVRRLEQRLKAPRMHMRSPEDEHHPFPVELAFTIAGQLFALEHTGIEPFKGHVQMEAEVRANLEAVKHRAEEDPKITLISHYLKRLHWLETHGSIIFSQFFDTAEWVAIALASAFPAEPVGLYAGHGNSFVLRGGDRVYADREALKAKVKAGDLRLMVATDAACEGLNLQRLGSQINVDLPWNPSRLEQRKGRVQRIGQLRDTIHVVNRGATR